MNHACYYVSIISLQTALEAASDYRKQVEENQGEKQQLVLSMQHELNQVSLVKRFVSQIVAVYVLRGKSWLYYHALQYHFAVQ